MRSWRAPLAIHFGVGVAAIVLLATSSTLAGWEWVSFFLFGVPWFVLVTRPGPLVAWIFPIIPLFFIVGLWLFASWANAVGRLGERGSELCELGEPALCLLREDQLTVREHVELALRPLFGLGLVPGLGVQLGRETRSP